MNAMTTRALLVGLLVALWAWVSVLARLNVEVWVGLVALGCFFAAGGGVSGLQRTFLSALSGVIWVLLADAVRVAVGGSVIVRALILGLMVCVIVLQSRVTLLSFTAGALAGAGVALGLRVNTVTEAIRVAVALAIGAVLGFVAERVTEAIGSRR